MTTTQHPTDRNGLEVLGLQECLALVASQPVGRIAFVHGGEPAVLPVNHVVVDGAIGFRTTPGSKLDHAIMRRPVAFEVDAVDPETRTGWSVLVRGVADLVEDTRAFDAAGDPVPVPWSAHAEGGVWMTIHAEEVSGRRLSRD